MPDLSLSRFLEIGPLSCVTFIGGGGKTTLMLSLARELQECGQSPVVTTTTKIWIPEDMPLILGDPSGLPATLARCGIACFGRRVSPERKLEGPDPNVLCAILSEGIGPLLVEADGSAGRSLKVHADHEPVVPSCSSHVLIVAGIDALGRNATDAVIHRAPLAHPAFGWTSEHCISAEDIAAVMSRMIRYVPPGSRLWFVLNKVDSDQDLRAAEHVATHLARAHLPVLVTSHGCVVTTASESAPARAGTP